MTVHTVDIRLSERVSLGADLAVPDDAGGVVVFAGRDPASHQVAAALHPAGLATVLVDLLTADEELADALTGEHRFDVELLSARIVAVVDWVENQRPTAGLPIGLFGAGGARTGAVAAALAAAADQP